jgi:hypothetical protein
VTALREMTREEIIQQILRQRPEITREAVLERLQTERNKTGGLIADTTLLRLIAAEYGVQVSADTVYDHELPINHLIPELNDVTVSGRVVAVYPAKTFEGKKSGKYASLMVADKEGVLRVMLWNDKANLVESSELKTGLLVRFSHGYTREDRAGKVELHLGEKSTVEINPHGLQAENYPSISKFATKNQGHTHHAGTYSRCRRYPSSLSLFHLYAARLERWEGVAVHACR